MADKEEVELDEEAEVPCRIDYKCYECQYAWREYYESACEGECPKCGARHVDPLDWVQLVEPPSAAYKRALAVVLDLAQQNVLEDEDAELAETAAKQQAACDLIAEALESGEFA